MRQLLHQVQGFGAAQIFERQCLNAAQTFIVKLEEIAAGEKKMAARRGCFNERRDERA
jgi:hypothetical protein